MVMLMSKRIPYFDNLKFILIYFVVLGHFLAPLRNIIPGVNFIYMIIYIFHMPLFIFILGYFSSSLIKDGKLKNNKIFNYLLLYIIMQVILYLIKDTQFTILYPQHGMWYLICIIIWSLLLPTFVKIKPKILIPLSFILGMLIGVDDRASDVLSINRAIVFLPYFLCGYYINNGKIIELINKIDIRKKVVALLFLMTLIIFLYLLPISTTGITKIMYGNSIVNITFYQAIGYRLIAYILSIFFSICILVIIPRKEYFFTSLGKNTLSVLCTHIILFQVYEKLELFNLVTDYIQLIIFCLIMFVFTIVLSFKFLSVPINMIMNLKFERFLKE